MTIVDNNRKETKNSKEIPIYGCRSFEIISENNRRIVFLFVERKSTNNIGDP